MSVFTKSLTNKGIALQAKAQAGSELRYTRFVIGDGRLSGQLLPTMTNVISSKKTVPVTKLKMRSPNEAIVGFTLSNQDVTSGFYFRELGLYAMDPDEGEILYLYANAGETADYIPPAGSDDVIQKSFDTLAFVGQAQNVTANIDHSLVYVTHPELNEAIAGLSIADASLTKKGITLLSNATNGTRENVAATEKAVKTAYDKGYKAEADAATAQARAAKAESDAATAQARAVTAEANAKDASLPRAGGTVSGALRVNGEITFADGSTFTQLKQSGVNAKQGIVDAINAMGGSASTNDSWAVLFSKVRALKTPMKRTVISGIGQSSASNVPNNYTVSGLDFVPKVVEVTIGYNYYHNGNWIAITTTLTADRVSGTTESQNSVSGYSQASIGATFTNNSVSLGITAYDSTSTGLLTTTIRTVRVYGD